MHGATPPFLNTPARNGAHLKHRTNFAFICGPKREDVTEGWRKLQSGELHNL
jgi:hypothetical protein